MQRLTRFVVFSGALAVVWACSGDPTNNQGTPTTIVANPEVVFVPQGDSQPVIVSVADEDGQALEAEFTATDVGSGITVVLDTAFLPVVSSLPADRSARFFVKGDQLTASQFTVQALGLTKVVKVTSVPAALAGTFSNAAPALGETVTLTAPTGTFFSDSSGLTFGGGSPFIVSQDATTFVFLAPPNVADQPGVVSNVGVTSNPNIVFSLPTSQTLKTDSVFNVPSTVSSTTPGGGQAVTFTSTDPLFTFGADTKVLVGLDTAFSSSVAADGSSITVIPTPSSTGPVTFSQVIIAGIGIDLPSTAPAVTAGAVPATAGTGAPGTAPTIAIPATGTSSRVIFDAVPAGYVGCGFVGVDCQVYKFTLSTDRTFDVAAIWEGTSDAGVYFLASDGTTQAGDASCDANANGAAGGHEECTQTLTAGTYFLAFVPFGPVYPTPEPLPAWVTVELTGE